MSERIQHKGLKAKLMSAEAAAALIPNGAILGASGFTGAGYPKAVPIALAKRAVDERLKGKPFKVTCSPAPPRAPSSTGDGPHGGDQRSGSRTTATPSLREKFNAGVIEYQDMHLSHAGVARPVRLLRAGQQDRLRPHRGHEDPRGRLGHPSSSVGANTAYLGVADKIILEVNEWQDERLEGMHDVYSVSGHHGEREPIPVVKADDRIGSPYIKIDVSKVAAVVESTYPDRNAPSRRPRTTTSGSPSTSSTSSTAR